MRHGCFSSQLSTYNPLIKTLQQHFLSLLLRRKNKHQGIGAGARYSWHCSQCSTINQNCQNLKSFCCIFPGKLSVSLIQTTDGRDCLLVSKRAARKIFQRTTSLKSVFTLATASNRLQNTSFSLTTSAFQYSHGSVSGPMWMGLYQFICKRQSATSKHHSPTSNQWLSMTVKFSLVTSGCQIVPNWFLGLCICNCVTLVLVFNMFSK